jgi:hypothetical protein
VITFGLAARNLGFALQFNDSPQADPPPKRIDLGVEFAPRLSQYPGLGVRLFGAVVNRVSTIEDAGLRFGTEISWLGQYFARGGYVFRGPTGSGPSLGGGIARGRWRVDFAQFLSDNSASTGQRPTYLSVQYHF